jgi:hypothetical protein
MINKMLNYERHPYTDAGFYDHPIIAGGWQTERWFILCCEIVFGHQANVLGKHPVREYAIYEGVPGTEWSSNPNTYMLVDYFGPNGLGYIPATPQHLTDWGGNATRINNDINAGAYMLIHRDHGAETGWGEPQYGNTNLSGLHNDRLPFVFSMNCLTGKYNWSSQCFTEAFHRMGQGALGLIAASEVSYSFVNDTYIFGLFDTMWPGFMPDYGPYPPQSHFATDLRPAFGQVSGKYFLQASSWPFNPGDKLVTYHLFHHHGDAFLTMYTEVPRNLNASHDEVSFIGTSTFHAQADLGSVIALTVNGEIVGVADATGLPQDIPIIPQNFPGTLRITVTKANYFRYDRTVPILPPDGPYLVLQGYSLLDAQGDHDGIPDAGEAIACDLTLRNVGVDPTSGITGALATADPFVTVTTPERAFPDLPPGAQGHCLEPYQVQVSGNAPDQHPVSMTLGMHANEGDWESALEFTVQAPVLSAGPALIDDSAPMGNGDGGADPGDRFRLMLWLHNAGHSSAPALNGTISCQDPNVVIHDADGDCTYGVPVGGDNTIVGFEVELRPECPSPTTIAFQIRLTAENGLDVTVPFELPVGAWVDDAEADRGWTVGAAGDNATTGFWVRAEPVGTTYNGQQAQPEYDHSPDPASVCYVTGNGVVGGAAGDSDVDGGKTTLLSPVFPLGGATTATVEYWRWYTNNLGNNPNQDYWDVDVTSDGVSWVHLEHTTNSANSWTHFTFDVGSFVPLTNQVQFRFVADDESPGSLVEGAVDDFVLTVTGQPATGVPAEAAQGRPGIVSVSPNPSSGALTIAYRLGTAAPARLSLYDVSGRLVRSLLDRPVTAGTHQEVFDGCDGRGNPVPSGIYFLRLETAGTVQAKRVAVLR